MSTSYIRGGGYNIIAVARRIPDFVGDNVLCLSCDVTDIDSVRNAVQLGIEKFGKIDVLVNNAGISTSILAEDETAERMKKVFEVNYFGAFNTINTLLPHFRANKNGTIVNNTSMHGISIRKYGSAYCTSKYALEGFTGVLRLETQNFCRVMAFELGYFPGTGIGKNANNIRTNVVNYKDIPGYYKSLKFPNCQNVLSGAIDAIIETIGNETLPRHLILGGDSLFKAKTEVKILQDDIKYSNRYAAKCSIKLGTHKNLRYFVDYLCYLKYRVLKNFVVGETQIRYRFKQQKYKNLLK